MSLPPQGPPPQGPPPPHGQPPHWPPPQQYPQQWPGTPTGPPPPPYGQTPYGQPPHWPPPQGQPWQWSPTGPPKKSGPSITLIALGLVGAFVVVMMGYGFYKALGGGGDTITAHSARDFSKVCENNDAVTNAAEYSKPYKIAAFYKGLGIMGTDWLPAQASKWANSESFTEINVVACMKRKPGTEVKTTTCEDDDDGEKVAVGYYSVDYEIEFREARTGKVIKDLGTVKGTAGDCPFLAGYDRKSRKMYAEPDNDAVAAKMSEFAG